MKNFNRKFAPAESNIYFGFLSMNIEPAPKCPNNWILSEIAGS
jgi:hypothetical protein